MSGSDLKLPVKAEPFDHQKKAFEFVLWLFGMIDGTVRSTGAALLMQMGTGKSFVSVAVAGWMFLHGKIKRRHSQNIHLRGTCICIVLSLRHHADKSLQRLAGSRE